MSRVWIDLTDLQEWGGHHGGTQRVTYGIAKEFFLSNDQSARFFAYSPVSDIFYEVEFGPIYDRVEGARTYDDINPASATGRRHAIKQRLLQHAPRALKDNRVIKDRVKRAGRLAWNSAKRANELRHRSLRVIKKHVTPAVGHEALVFKSDDVILILGKPWDNPGLQVLLSSQKRIIGFKVAQVVYDLIISLYPHLHHPSLFKLYTQHMFDAAVVSDLMLPISRSSDSDLKEFGKQLNLAIPKTSVIRLGDELDNADHGEKPALELEGDFILCVGTIENRKNHTLLYQAYKLALSEGHDMPQLVIVGGQGWLADDIRYLISHDAQVKKKIILAHGISDGSLSWLYQNCKFTVFPSLYEGWGLPVAESMTHGKLTLSSNISSMPEIGGALAAYFSPYDSRELMELIRTYHGDKKKLQSMQSKVLKEYKPTTWRQTYEQVVRAIAKL